MDNVDRMLKMAGIGWQNIVVLDRTGEGAPFSPMTERMGTWRPCRPTRAVTSGVPGAKVLCDITAVARRDIKQIPNPNAQLPIHLGVGSWELGVGSWELGVGSRELIGSERDAESELRGPVLS